MCPIGTCVGGLWPGLGDLSFSFFFPFFFFFLIKLKKRIIAIFNLGNISTLSTKKKICDEKPLIAIASIIVNFFKKNISDIKKILVI